MTNLGMIIMKPKDPPVKDHFLERVFFTNTTSLSDLDLILKPFAL